MFASTCTTRSARAASSRGCASPPERWAPPLGPELEQMVQRIILGPRAGDAAGAALRGAHAGAVPARLDRPGRALQHALPLAALTMANYLIGDIQGCDAPLARLLAKIGYLAQPRHALPAGRPGEPRAGVGGGAAPADGLRRLRALPAGQPRPEPAGRGAWLPRAAPQRHHGRHPARPDREAMLDWLRHRSMALQRTACSWCTAACCRNGTWRRRWRWPAEVEAALRGPRLPDFLAHMWGNQPDHWDDALEGRRPAARDRQCAHAAALLHPRGRDGPEGLRRAGPGPPGMLPWFDPGAGAA